MKYSGILIFCIERGRAHAKTKPGYDSPIRPRRHNHARHLSPRPIEDRERTLEQHLATHYNISADTYSIDGTLSLSRYVYDLTFEDEPDAAYTFQVEQATDGHRVKFEQADHQQLARVTTFAP